MKGVRMRCMLWESSRGEQGSQVLKKKIKTVWKRESSDRAGMQAVIRIASTVSRFEKDRQTGCTCSMAIPSLDNVG